MKSFDYYIFDLDGTLYSQKTVRKGMALMLLCGMCSGDISPKGIIGIYKFRKAREKEINKQLSIAELCKSLGVDINIIETWMFKKPLELVQKACFNKLKKYINKCIDEGKKVIIYSDYPVEEKMASMDIKYSSCYYPGCGGVEELKPSKDVMEYIINREKIVVSNCCYVGDRDEKDGVSAGLVGITYYDTKEFREMI